MKVVRELEVNTLNKEQEVFIFGLPDDYAGWLFYVPDAKRTFVPTKAIFDKDCTPSLCTPDLVDQIPQGMTIPYHQ